MLQNSVARPRWKYEIWKLANAGFRARTNRKPFVRLTQVGDLRAHFESGFSALVRCLLLWLQPRLGSSWRGFLVKATRKYTARLYFFSPYGAPVPDEPRNSF